MGYKNNDIHFHENTVFIVADFGETVEQSNVVVEKINAIKDVCVQLGLSARSAKDFLGGGNIVNKIKKAIEDAEFIICDISEPRGVPNPNVYYEFGFAHGCENDDNDLFTICDRDTFSRLMTTNGLPFDIRSEAVYKMGNTEELRSIVKKNLEYMMSVRSR